VYISISHKIPLADIAPSALQPAANGDACSVITFGGRSLTELLRLASSFSFGDHSVGCLINIIVLGLDDQSSW
jgi:hypothetical protein